jgi:hypothetical protein
MAPTWLNKFIGRDVEHEDKAAHLRRAAGFGAQSIGWVGSICLVTNNIVRAEAPVIGMLQLDTFLPYCSTCRWGQA